MKSYAEYYKLQNGDCYRKKTLLHLGNSTDLIGSAVLTNPGSAEPIGEPDTEMIKEFYSNIHKIEIHNFDDWKTSSMDPTMLQLVKVFNGWYVGKQKKLNGIIQLFNCSYYKNQNLDEALERFNSDSPFIFSEHHLFINKPVYFGWGNAGKSLDLKQIAANIFSKYNHKYTPIYNLEFAKNSFYHPGYINRSYNRNLKTKELMTRFEELINVK